jgi:threonylcarbamoyladenosine tRNA methylthiotransferase MtaB
VGDRSPGGYPGLAVTTDIIVGFPGETEDEFAQSLDFVQRMEFSRAHVFPFSARAGTPAEKMPDQVSPQIKAQRARAMRKTASTSQQAFGQSYIGRTLDVLWEAEKERKEGTFWSGLTDNYLRVYARSSADLANRLVPVRLVATAGNDLLGEIAT